MNIQIERKAPGYLYSPISEKRDTRPAEIHSFYPEAHPHLLKEFENYILTIYKNDDHRMKNNYLNQNFHEHAVISLWKREGQPVGFATAWSRPFYPEGAVRILNRIYHDKNKSRVFFTREVARPSTLHCLFQQYLLIKELGFEIAFISREMRATRFFKNFIERISELTPSPWEYRRGPFRVAPSDDFSCQQAIGATSLTGNSLNRFFDSWERGDG